MQRTTHPRSFSSPTNVEHSRLELNKLRFPASQLYGRETEKAHLRDALRRVCRRRRDSRGSEERRYSNTMPDKTHNCDDKMPFPEMVLLSGLSGTGKSALAQNLSSIVNTTKNLFVSGKFDQEKQSEPYTAFMSAFNRLCEITAPTQNLRTDLSEHSSILAIQSSLCSSIGSESALLTEIIPKLSLFFDNQEITTTNNKSADMGYETAKNKFNFLLRQFVRAFCREKTLVLFLDDLQWADVASLELLKTLLLDRNNPGLLIIGSYRNDEVQDVKHPLT
eukprot:7691578-Ditylum_brightwellii.AAC.1